MAQLLCHIFFGRDEHINIKINDLLNPDNNISTKDEIQSKLKCNLNTLRITSLTQAIPKEWRVKIRNYQHSFKEILPMHIRINNTPKAISNSQSRMIYWELLNETTKPPTAIATWLNLFPFLEKVDWKRVFLLPFKVTKEPYLQ